ncbi:MAG: hypothetical protein ACRC7N_03605 [Clostridium sp.]
MRNKDLVLVYASDFEGYQVATLERLISVKEESLLECWLIKTVTQGTELVRWVKGSSDYKEDGCGYMIYDIHDIFFRLQDELTDIQITNLVNVAFKGKKTLYKDGEDEEIFIYKSMSYDTSFINGEYPFECCEVQYESR